jgi:tetratricopeptide (TPR) repeat protein
MPKEDWYRRSTWLPQDQTEFFSRLKRARSSSRGQYLRIQANYLSEAKLFAEAIDLLSLLLSEYRDELQTAQAYLQQAECYAALDQDDLAIEAYRNSLESERNYRGIRTEAWLEFSSFIVRKKLISLFPEADQILSEFNTTGAMAFPRQRFEFHFARAHIANHQNDRVARRTHAERALEAADETHSGFRYHSQIGLVRDLTEEDRLILKLWAKSTRAHSG